MKRKGRLPLKSLIQSATFMTRVRLSSSSVFTFREAVWRRSVFVSRRRLPVAVRSAIAA